MNVETFANRLLKNARHWRKWARRRGIECYRIYDRDIPEFPFAVDVYGARAHLQAYSLGHAEEGGESEQVLAVHKAVADVLGFAPADVILKRRSRRGHREQHEKTGVRGEDFIVHEGGLRFFVNLEAYLDCGLFLDHRNTRAMVAADAHGRRVLNLFCYTASFTVYAGCAGARESLSLDLSNTYLEWARRNLELNGLDLRRHRLQRTDVLDWLAHCGPDEAFDLIVLDPPAFSTSKAMSAVLDVQRDHATMLQACVDLLTPGGIVYFSTNLRTFKMQWMHPDVCGEEVSARTVPEDFRNRRIHRCWRFQKTPNA